MDIPTETAHNPQGPTEPQTQSGSAVTVEDVFCVEGEIILYVTGGVWSQHIPETLLLVSTEGDAERISRQLEAIVGLPGAVDVVVNAATGRIYAIGAYHSGHFTHLWGTLGGRILSPAPALSPQTLARIVNGSEAGMVVGTSIVEVAEGEITLIGGRAWVGGVNYHIPSVPLRVRPGDGGPALGGDGRIAISMRSNNINSSWADAIAQLQAHRRAWGRIAIASDGNGGGVWLYDHGSGKRELVVAVSADVEQERDPE